MCGRGSRLLSLVLLSLLLFFSVSFLAVAEVDPVYRPLTDEEIQRMTLPEIVTRLNQNVELLKTINAKLSKENSELKTRLLQAQEKLIQALLELSDSRAESTKAAESWMRTSDFFVASLTSQDAATAQAARTSRIWRGIAFAAAGTAAGTALGGSAGAAIGAGTGATIGIILYLLEEWQ